MFWLAGSSRNRYNRYGVNVKRSSGVTLNWPNGSSIEIGGYTMMLDYAINAGKVFASQPRHGPDFPL